MASEPGLVGELELGGEIGLPGELGLAGELGVASEPGSAAGPGVASEPGSAAGLGVASELGLVDRLGVLGVVPVTARPPLENRLPLPFSPGPSAPTDPLSSAARIGTPACTNVCRSVSAEALIATSNAAVITAVARLAGARRACRCGMPGRARQRSWALPSTVCSHTQPESRAPRSTRPSSRQVASSTAPSAGPGSAPGHRPRALPNPPQHEARGAEGPHRHLGAGSCLTPSTSRSADIARAMWLLTAPRLIPIAEAISASDKSA